MIPDQKHVTDFYTRNCAEAKESWQAHHWGNKQNQFANYEVASSVLDWDNKCTLLDVGCGQGDFYEYLKSCNPRIKYAGIDITPAMVEAAKKRFPKGLFVCADFFSDQFPTDQYDYVTAIGTFSMKVSDNDAYIRAAISKVWSLTKKAAVIIMATSKAGVPIAEDDPVHTYDPIDIFQYCLTLTPYIMLKHATHGVQMTFVLFRPAT